MKFLECAVLSHAMYLNIETKIGWLDCMLDVCIKDLRKKGSYNTWGFTQGSCSRGPNGKLINMRWSLLIHWENPSRIAEFGLPINTDIENQSLP